MNAKSQLLKPHLSISILVVYYIVYNYDDIHQRLIGVIRMLLIIKMLLLTKEV